MQHIMSKVYVSINSAAQVKDGMKSRRVDDMLCSQRMIVDADLSRSIRSWWEREWMGDVYLDLWIFLRVAHVR